MPIPIRSFFISPCEDQIRAIADSAGKYQRLYQIEHQISDDYRRADLISQAQYVRADSAYRAEQTRADRTMIRIGIEQNRAEIAETKLEAIEGQQPHTWAGRTIRKVGNTGRNVLAGLGAGTIAVITLKLLL